MEKNYSVKDFFEFLSKMKDFFEYFSEISWDEITNKDSDKIMSILITILSFI